MYERPAPTTIPNGTPPDYSTYGSKPPALAEGTARPRFELASPYGPGATEGAADTDFAAGALHTAREGWNEMQAAHPDFYLGMTVYGSLVKGRAHEKSDLDAVIFFDPESPYAQSLDSPTEAYTQPNKDIREHISSRFEQQGYNKTFQGVGSYTKQPLNQRFLDEALGFAQYACQKNTLSVQKNLDNSLTSLFYMRVGNGSLQDYRQHVLNRLASIEEGETIWQAIAGSLGEKEEMRRGAEIVLPQTIAEATDYFHLHEPAVPGAKTPDGAETQRRVSRFRQLLGRLGIKHF